MKKIASIVLFFAFAGTAVAQTGIVKGIVKDSVSGFPLEAATISVFAKDSSLLNYQLSDKYGMFNIGKLPTHTNVLFNVTYTGYKSYSKIIILDSTVYDAQIVLSPSFNDSANVTVTAYIPIRMNGDTLEINPAAFKMGPNAVIEDLLTQVPGITIWADGTITMNGKKVPNVLVDGKPFMGTSDARIATQNLPKDAIDKIQVYQEIDKNVKMQDRQPKDSIFTMNIKLKEDKKTGYFGKFGIGYGTRNRFESNLSFQMYNKKTSFGIGGGYNNVNKNISNLTEMFQNDTYRNYNPNLYYVGNFDNDGISKNHSIGGVYTHNFIETTNSRQNDRITVNYVKSGNETNLVNQSLQNITTLDNPQLVQSNTTNNSNYSNHTLGINYIKTNSYNDNFTINGNAGTTSNRSNAVQTTDVRDTANSPQSFSTTKSTEYNNSNNQSVSINYAKNNEENYLKNFSVDIDVNHAHNNNTRFINNDFTSFINSAADTVFNRRYNTVTNTFSLSSTLVYNGFKRLLLRRYNLFGIDLKFNNWFYYAKNKSDNRVLDFDSTLKGYTPNNSLTYNNVNEKFEYTPYLSLSKSLNKWNEARSNYFYFIVNILDDIKYDRNESTIAPRNLSRSFAFLRYETYIYYYYNKQNKYNYNINFNYRKNFEYPSIDQLYTIVDDINLYNVQIGNPYLKNKINHTYSGQGSFSISKPDAKYAFNSSLSGTYQKSLNIVTDSIINDPSGKRSSYLINGKKGSNYNMNYSFNISKKLKKNTLQLIYNGSFNNNNRPNYIDAIYTQTKTSSLNNDITFQFDLHSLFVANLGKTFSNYYSKQSGEGLTSYKSFSDITKLGLTLNYPVNFSFSTSVSNTNNTSIDKSILLWNAFASYRFLKGEQAEFKFSAFDILKQFRNISNSADNYGTTLRITNGMQQYFMLTFSYFPRKFGKTVVKKQEIKQEW